MRREALLSQPPDRPHNEAFKRPEGLGGRLALGLAPIQICSCLRQIPRLRQGDPMEERIEPPIAAAIEPVAHPARRGRFEGRHAGVGGELRFGGEPPPWPQDAGERPSGELVDTTHPRQGEKAAAREVICCSSSSACSSSRRNRWASRRTAAARS